MGVEPSMFDVKYKGLSTEEAMRQAERDKLLYAQKEALQEQNRLFQQQLQMQQQVLEHQQEAERQRRIAENNAEIERLTNMLREHCRAIGIDYDYMINFYENCYKEKDATEEILIMEEEINAHQDFIKIIKLKEELKPLKKKQLLFALLIAPLSCFIPVVSIMLFATQKYLLAVISLLLIILFIKPWKNYLNLSKIIDNRRSKCNELRFKYSTNKYGTIQDNEQQIKELKLKKDEKVNELNVNSKKCQQDFDEFRKNHYNKEIELLFKDLEIGFNKIAPSEAKGEGSIAEYDEYIKDKILEN